jgi:hypothetical protein
MIVNSTPRKTSTLFCPDESRDCIIHIARDLTDCKSGTHLDPGSTRASRVGFGASAERTFSEAVDAIISSGGRRSAAPLRGLWFYFLPTTSR